jgi:RimJ/RimL family protein N-acetyltransferase
MWAPSQRNKDYGTEAAALLIDYGFNTLHLNRIELEVYTFNPPGSDGLPCHRIN